MHCGVFWCQRTLFLVPAHFKWYILLRLRHDLWPYLFFHSLSDNTDNTDMSFMSNTLFYSFLFWYHSPVDKTELTMPKPNVYGTATCHPAAFLLFSACCSCKSLLTLSWTLYHTFLPSAIPSHPVYNSDIKKKERSEHNLRTEHSGLIYLHCLSGTQLDCRIFRMKGRV